MILGVWFLVKKNRAQAHCKHPVTPWPPLVAFTPITPNRCFARQPHPTYANGEPWLFVSSFNDDEYHTFGVMLCNLHLTELFEHQHSEAFVCSNICGSTPFGVVWVKKLVSKNIKFFTFVLARSPRASCLEIGFGLCFVGGMIFSKKMANWF